jgi:cobalt-zinc-cadmium efflux system outer membrane protein
VERAFYDVVLRKEELVQAQENLSLVEDLARRVRVEVDVDEKGKLELTRAEAELARARAAIRRADIQLANARAVLKAVIGSSSNETFDTGGALGDGITIQPLSELRQKVLANHPALSESNAITARSRAVVQQEQARRIPQPNLYGEYERQPDITFFRFGVSIPLALWDWREGGQSLKQRRKYSGLKPRRINDNWKLSPLLSACMTSTRSATNRCGGSRPVLCGRRRPLLKLRVQLISSASEGL